MIKQGLAAFRGKRVLLLQGPLGPFFRRLATDLTAAGAKVSKVNFNGGDCLFYPTGAHVFRGSAAEWPAYFRRLIRSLRIDVVLLFGDCRPLHRVAYEIAERRGLEIGVFEEGYVRPDYVTLERFGVNGNSRIPRTPIYYLNKPIARVETPRPVGAAFWYAAAWACLYYLAAFVAFPWFHSYRHHRPLTPLEAWPWLRSFWRKAVYAVKQRGVLRQLTGNQSKRFFLVPLQVQSDAQVRNHSDYADIPSFIAEVVASFARHAPDDAWLVIKHHPMDRGYTNYQKLIAQLAQSHGIQQRVRYVRTRRMRWRRCRRHPSPTASPSARGPGKRF